MNKDRIPILVWDLPTRAFHWLLALSFLGAYLSCEADGYRTLHVIFGYTVAGLLVFRLIWGIAGTRFARFSAFALFAARRFRVREIACFRPPAAFHRT